jgi:hypothetical protein
MKQIKSSDLKLGDIFAKEIKLHGRECFRVAEIPKDKNYIIVEERNIQNQLTKEYAIRSLSLLNIKY